MKKTTASLLFAALFAACPVLAQADAPAGVADEAETDIEIINGVPVNPELKDRIMQMQKAGDDAPTVQELIELSYDVLNKQQEQLAEQNKQADDSWLRSDPLGTLEGEMSEIVGSIDESNTGDDTQAQGKEVVRKMDTLIAMMEKACSACSSCAGGGGQGNKPGQGFGNQPAPDSTLASGPGGSGDLSAKGQGNSRFENLDPEQRDAILRAQSDQAGFPAEYDDLLAEYYARLASERALENQGDAPDSE